MNELKHVARFNNELGNITISNEGVRFEGVIHNFTWDEFSFHAVISGLTYSRKDEKKADEQALEYLKKAKISANGIANFFERIDDFEIKWLSTHPLSFERIKKFKRHLRNESQLSSVNFDMTDFD